MRTLFKIKGIIHGRNVKCNKAITSHCNDNNCIISLRLSIP